ncbi:MAG: pentapeptide repeat-containing protein [Xenococcaceae cyanobacterium]
MTKRRHLILLKQDVNDWNSWRQENSEIELDFSDANLSNLNLSGANLSQINLSGVDFQGANLRCAYLKGANLDRAILVDANLSGSDLSEAELKEADLSNADLIDANLTNADLSNSSALSTNFKNSIFTGVCLENWQIDSSTNLEEIACDYFYGKSQKKQRYPEDETQNFLPGEYYKYINPDTARKDTLVLPEDSLSEPNLNSLEENNHSLDDSISGVWEDELSIPRLEMAKLENEESLPSENLASKFTNFNISQGDRVNRKNSIIQLSIALILGTIVTTIALVQVFKKSPNPPVSDDFISCDHQLIKQAEEAIFVRNEAKLSEIMTLLQDFNSPLGGFGNEKCRQTLYEVKYTYAIEIKANQENKLLEAVAILCSLPEQYYQDKESKPWFSRWVNSFANTSFPEQLADYIEIHGCPGADYLYSN